MELVKPSFTIEGSEIALPGNYPILRSIERAGRTCYLSEGKNDPPETAKTLAFVKKLIDSGHHSVIEHEKMTVRIICDRGVTHELVRHRIASFSQESTRYCNYGGDHIKFILPPWVSIEPGVYDDLLDDHTPDNIWFNMMIGAEAAYNALLKGGWAPQQARDVLPNSLKTEIVITANLREWRHIFKERAVNTKAHPQMREIMIPMLARFKEIMPVIFDDLVVPEDTVGKEG